MTRRISAVAVCCSSASVSARLRPSISRLQICVRLVVGLAPVKGPAHSSQNFACGRFSCWHRGQCISNVSRFRLACRPRSRGADPGPPPELGFPAVRGARAPRPYRDPASGARWAVSGEVRPGACEETPSAAPTSQYSRLRHAPDSYTPSWGLDPTRLRPQGTGWHTRGVPACGPWRREREIVHNTLAKISRGAPKIDPPYRKNFLGDARRFPYRGRGSTPARIGEGPGGNPTPVPVKNSIYLSRLNLPRRVHR